MVSYKEMAGTRQSPSYMLKNLHRATLSQPALEFKLPVVVTTVILFLNLSNVLHDSISHVILNHSISTSLHFSARPSGGAIKSGIGAKIEGVTP